MSIKRSRAATRSSLKTARDTNLLRAMHSIQSESVRVGFTKHLARRACARQVMRGNVAVAELHELLQMLDLDITPAGLKRVRTFMDNRH